MTGDNGRILERAIAKSERGGWDLRGYEKCIVAYSSDKNVQGVQLVYDQTDDLMTSYLSVFDLIFSHDFAIGIWGHKIICLACGAYFTDGEVTCTDEKCSLAGHDVAGLPAFKFHLQQMVTSVNPMRYLAERM